MVSICNIVPYCSRYGSFFFNKFLKQNILRAQRIKWLNNRPLKVTGQFCCLQNHFHWFTFSNSKSSPTLLPLYHHHNDSPIIINIALTLKYWFKWGNVALVEEITLTSRLVFLSTYLMLTRISKDHCGMITMLANGKPKIIIQ